MPEELFEIVDEKNRVIGTALRSECHGNPALIHRTSHVVVYHPDGRMLLQKRSMNKDIQPGKWDTAVGGHLDIGESFEDAARREMGEELGLDPKLELTPLFESKIRNDIESENIMVYSLIHPGPFQIQKEEIDEVKFWSKEDIISNLETSLFTPNFVNEVWLLLGDHK